MVLMIRIDYIRLNYYAIVYGMGGYSVEFESQQNSIKYRYRSSDVLWGKHVPPYAV